MHSEGVVSNAEESERQNVFCFLDLSLEENKEKFLVPKWSFGSDYFRKKLKKNRIFSFPSH